MKVSVCMITYNHERFIAQALDSALMQQVDFDYEIVVGEDCSTDATREILLAYQEKFPERIRLLLPEKNLGMMRNFAETIKACRGEYIALLEGDDYWTSPDKLQKQVDFLEVNKDCVAAFHNVEIVHEEDSEKNRLYYENDMKKKYNRNDFAGGNFVQTCSVIFRSQAFSCFPSWCKAMPMGDWPLHILNSEHGSYGYINEVMAAYRVHCDGVWSCVDRKKILERSIIAANIMKSEFDYNFVKKLKKTINRWKFELLIIEANNNSTISSFFLAIKIFILYSFHPVFFFRALKFIVKKYSINYHICDCEK